MKQLIISFFLISIIASTGCNNDKNKMQHPSDFIFVNKKMEYTIKIPTEFKLSDKEDLKNLSLPLGKDSYYEFIGASNKSPLRIRKLRGDMSKDPSFKIIKKLNPKKRDDFLISSFKVMYTNKAKNLKVKKYTNPNSVSGFNLSFNLKENDIHNKIFMVIKGDIYHSFMLRDDNINGKSDAEMIFKKIIDSIDFSKAGIKNAKVKKIEFEKQFELYNAELEKSGKDGLFTGLWMGFSIPFKYVINFIKENDYPYHSNNHTPITYWIGFVLGFIPGIGIFFSFISGN
jgi:hypothetical protein